MTTIAGHRLDTLINPVTTSHDAPAFTLGITDLFNNIAMPAPLAA